MTRPTVAIVGCGLIGQKRKNALVDGELCGCVDSDIERAVRLAGAHPGIAVATSLEELVRHRATSGLTPIDVVVVATTNESLASVACTALDAGAHVLVEKPAGRSIAEIDSISGHAKRANRQVRVGFNHRYHPAIQKAKEILECGELGRLMMVRGRYGHGGRIGYDREWRADPVRSGGGELIDQGVHLIDLSRWFLQEEFVSVSGFADTFFWDMPVDDNAFLTLRTDSGATAFLHVSCSEWKNLFSMEIYGRTGKLQIDGLGGSYGVERLTWYRMLPEMGPPETTAWEYPRGDSSWALEMRAFLNDIKLNRRPSADLDAARSALAVVDDIYRQSPRFAQP